MWLVFSDTWNAILDELRSIDLLSERERRNLIFLHLPINDTIEVRIISMGGRLHVPLKLIQHLNSMCLLYLGIQSSDL